MTFGGQYGGPCSNLKETVSSVPEWFRADSGTNLIKQGENVTGRSSGSIAVVECSHGKRETLGSSPGRATFFFPLFNYIRPRICSEPCRNRRDSLFQVAARSPSTDPHTGHQMSQGRKKNVARPGLEPRVYRLPCEHSTTELPSHSIDRLHHDRTAIHMHIVTANSMLRTWYLVV